MGDEIPIIKQVKFRHRKMNTEQSEETYPTPFSNTNTHQQHQNLDDHDQQIDRILLERIMALSLQEHVKHTFSKNNGLNPVYRKLVRNMKMSKSSQQCTVCIQGFHQGQYIKRFPCKHIFHRECAKAWLRINKTCPVCRMDLEKHFKGEEEQAKKVQTKSPI